MELKFVSGVLEDNPKESAIDYIVTFRMSLDFTHFVQMANQYIPGYLEQPINAVRPELDGLAYHYAYNYFFDAAGKIDRNEALFNVFTPSSYYMDQWSSGGLEKRYGKPVFDIVDGQLQVTARTDFRWEDKRQIQISDLPVISFQWALHLYERELATHERTAPVSKVVVGYAEEDRVEVEGHPMLRGTLYMVGKKLEFGEIRKDRILTAG
ncbi:hypothetical protein [Pseudomonas sp. ANT_J28]|uniref:hypothetical protein n=1 Tax=Pseudomonas sp. ANT_J28 TaxID=2597352 RepID=UPI002115158B|nr:hypothetical protein [Pseudomonas sp. ANT_J28]